MGLARNTVSALRADPAAAAVIREWRTLTGGAAVRDPERRTLVACSGGCDSSALALTLAAASPHLVIAHIMHDLRPPEEAHADRDATRALAESLGLPFATTNVEARREGGNLEATARTLRYRALVDLARQNRCPFIVTAHHADDLLETMLMRLLRGTGPAGLAPIWLRRRMGGLTIVRPMLTITREDAERLCRIAGHTWRTDASNEDTSFLRNDLRANVIPHLRRLSPTVAQRAAATAALLGESAAVISGAARKLRTQAASPAPGVLTWPRQLLRRVPAIILGALLRQSAQVLARGWRADRLSHRVLTAAAEAIRDHSTDPRTFTWAPVTVTITAHDVTVAVNPLPGPVDNP